MTVRGRVRRRDDAVQLQAMEVSLPDVSAADSRPVTITMPESRCTPPVVEKLRDVLAAHPGVTQVNLKLSRPGERSLVVRLQDTYRVERTTALFGDLKALLGPGCLVP